MHPLWLAGLDNLQTFRTGRKVFLVVIYLEPCIISLSKYLAMGISSKSQIPIRKLHSFYNLEATSQEHVYSKQLSYFLLEATFPVFYLYRSA